MANFFSDRAKALKKLKSQASLEYLVVVGIVLTIMIPLWLYLNNSANFNKEELRLSYARVAVNRIKDAADIVYVQGRPAKMKVLVNLPEGINSTRIFQNEILIIIEIREKSTDVYAVSVANLTGSLPLTQGLVEITVEALDDRVRIYTE